MEMTSKSYLSLSLMLAAEAAREGNTTDAAMFISNIADVFFPVDGADDPLWPTAAGCV